MKSATATELKFFDGCMTVEEAKTRYRKLARDYHPDLHHADEKDKYTRIMQELNAEYLALLKSFDQQTSRDGEGKEHTYFFKEDQENLLIQKIGEIIAVFAQELGGYNPLQRELPNPVFKVRFGFDLYYEVEIILIGSWIWIVPEGEQTRPYSSLLGGKGVGCKWHGERGCWYFKGSRGRYRKASGDLSDLAARYGGRRVRANEDE